MSDLITVGNDDFDKEVLQAKLPVLLDFSAPWCAPCKTIEPILQDLAVNEWQGKVKIVKINTDDNPETAARCGVMGLPTLLLYKDGKQVEGLRISGYKPKKKLQEEVEKYL